MSTTTPVDRPASQPDVFSFARVRKLEVAVEAETLPEPSRSLDIVGVQHWEKRVAGLLTTDHATCLRAAA
jgi:hypothetical protein